MKISKRQLRRIIKEEMELKNIVLDFAGLVPGVGETADLLNVMDFAVKGDYLYSALSAVSVIPAIGNLVGKGGKVPLAVSTMGKGGSNMSKAAETAAKSKKLTETAVYIIKLKEALQSNIELINGIFGKLASIDNEELQEHLPKIRSAISTFIGEAKEIEDDTEGDPDVLDGDKTVISMAPTDEGVLRESYDRRGSKVKNIRTLPVKFDERYNSSYLVRSVVREHLLHSAKPILPLNEALLREGLVGSVVRDAVQFVAAGGAEYGLAALAVPSAGATLAAAPVAETAVDAAFSAKAIGGAIAGFADISNELGEFGELWSEAIEAYDSDLSSYYKKLVILVQKALTILGEKAENKVEDLADALQQKMEDLVRRLSSTVKSGVKLVTPDATIGLAIAKGFETIMLSLAKNSFNLLAKVVNSFDIFKRFVADPSIAVDFFKDVFLQIIDLMNAASEKLTDTSWLKAILLNGPAGAIALKKLGPAGLKKAADVIKAQLPMILKAVDGVLTVLVPTTITAVGIYQIMMRDDWKQKKTPQEQKQLAASYNRRGTKMKITKRQLRRIIKEEVQSLQEAAPPLPDSIKSKASISPGEMKVAKVKNTDYSEVFAGIFYGSAASLDFAEHLEAVAAWPVDSLIKSIDFLCDSLSSYDGWGEYQSKINKACKLFAKLAVSPQIFAGLLVKYIGKLIKVLPDEMIYAFTASIWPNTMGGRASKKALDKINGVEEPEAKKSDDKDPDDKVAAGPRLSLVAGRNYGMD